MDLDADVAAPSPSSSRASSMRAAGGLKALSMPTHLVAATRGKHDDAKAFLSDHVVSQWTTRLPTLTAERADANHLTILFSPQVAQAVRR